MDQEYRLSATLMYTLGLLTAGMGILPWFFVPVLAGPVSWLVYFICWTLVWVAMGLFCITEYLRWRLTVNEDSVALTTTFYERTLPVKEIRGYRRVKQQIVLQPRDERLKPIKFSLYTSDNAGLLAWIEASFSNLDDEDAAWEQAKMISSESLGENKDERRARLRSIRTVATILNILGFALFGCSLFYDVMLVDVFFLFACYAVIAWSQGVVDIEGKKGSKRPQISLAMVLGGMTVALGAAGHMAHVVSWIPLIPYYIAGCLVAFLPFLYVYRKYCVRFRPGLLPVILIALMACLPWGIGVSLYANYKLDKSEREQYSTVVTRKRISHGKSTSYYIYLAPVGPLKEEEQVSVGKERYGNYQEGDTILLITGKGRLNAPWYAISN